MPRMQCVAFSQFEIKVCLDLVEHVTVRRFISLKCIRARSVRVIKRLTAPLGVTSKTFASRRVLGIRCYIWEGGQHCAWALASASVSFYCNPT